MGRNGDLAMGRQQTADNATSIVKTFRAIRFNPCNPFNP
jgi:hypothetical protein